MRNLGDDGGIDEAYGNFPLVPADEIDNGVLTFERRHESLYAIIVCLDKLDSGRERVANFQRITRKRCYGEVGCEEVLNYALSQRATGLCYVRCSDLTKFQRNAKNSRQLQRRGSLELMSFFGWD